MQLCKFVSVYDGYVLLYEWPNLVINKEHFKSVSMIYSK